MATKGLMCATCSDAANYVLLNGEEIEIYCESDFKDVLVDLALNNDPFAIHSVPADARPAAFSSMNVFRVGEE